MKYLSEIKAMFLPGFLLNFVWEDVQSNLYQYHFNGSVEFAVVHIRASLGDVFILFLIYFLGYFIFKESTWFIYLNNLNISYTILSGFIIGVTIEKICLQDGRWSYNQAMPIIPLLEVGLSPILQMTMLPLATLAIAKRLLKTS